MEVRPADLGAAWHIAVVRLRAGNRQDTPKPQIGRLGRRWMRGTELSQEVAAQALPLTSAQTRGGSTGIFAGMLWLPIVGLATALEMHSPGMLAATAAATGGLSWLTFDFVPRKIFQAMTTHPLTEKEINRLREQIKQPDGGSVVTLEEKVLNALSEKMRSLIGFGGKTDPILKTATLEEEYLNLVADTMRTKVSSPEGEAQLREALKLLGEAVTNLPPLSVGIQEEVGDIVADAEMLLARARRESDRVISESLIRQAEAKAAQARAVQNATQLIRRTKILREELRAQIAATRAALPSLSQSAAISTAPSATLTRVASSVRAVSREAASVLAAQEELAAALGETWPTASSVSSSATVSAESAKAAAEAELGRWTAPKEDDTRRVKLGRR